MATIASRSSSTLFRRQIALPQDHGSWVFIFSPLLIGLFAGGWVSTSAYLIVAAMAAFLIRQPVTMLVKIYSRRRPRRDLASAWFWSGVYVLLGLVGVAGLAFSGHAYLLWLALPGVPVFIVHLLLVSRREERRQIGVELVGCGVLALAAPAAYWVGIGEADPSGWWLFGLVWFQSAASIVYAYLRLEQRELTARPPDAVLLRMSRRAFLYTGFNLFATLVLSLLNVLPDWIWLPFALQSAETLHGALVKPAIGWKPTRIGVRQLIVSTLFTLLFILVWR
ncbi:MAG TPA: YwiC-like family protein [Anaerolineales bacterium]|nr:YwiC-like family protein [Anaerolineales bacterium]